MKEIIDNKKIFIFVTIVLAIVAAVYLLTKQDVQEIVDTPEDKQEDAQQDTGVEDMSENNDEVDNEEEILPEEPVEETKRFQFEGILEDVLKATSLADRRGLVTNGGATGVAMYSYVDGVYDLYVTFENLPEPNGDDFYEGWVVRQEPFDFVSTGKVVLDDGVYVNRFLADEDYREYDFYVLTIEPNDGDPAPAGHVVEGFMDKVIDE